jgi:S1-C subfamily serine protease
VVGDVLRAVDGVTVTSVDDVLRRVGSRAPGDTIVVTVDGGAAGREVRVVLGEQTL